MLYLPIGKLSRLSATPQDGLVLHPRRRANRTGNFFRASDEGGGILLNPRLDKGPVPGHGRVETRGRNRRLVSETGRT